MHDNDGIGYDLSFKTGILHFPERLFLQPRAIVQGPRDVTNRR